MEDAAGETLIELKLTAATVIFRFASPCTVPDFAVIVTVPLATPLAIPLELMVAMAVSDELQVTEAVISLLLPSENLPRAVNCCVAPAPTAVVPGDTCRLLKEAELGVGVGVGVVGVGVGTKAGFGVALPPPPQPLKKQLAKVNVSRMNLIFTLFSRPSRAIRQENMWGEEL